MTAQAAKSWRESNRGVGERGEQLAADHLCAQGMEILARNWRCRWGEIDLIAVESVGGRRTVVFCEVKSRTGRGYGSPLESITFTKLQRLRRLAGHWLAEQGGRGAVRSAEIRIDAIGIVFGAGAPEVNHVRAAG